VALLPSSFALCGSSLRIYPRLSVTLLDGVPALRIKLWPAAATLLERRSAGPSSSGCAGPAAGRRRVCAAWLTAYEAMRASHHALKYDGCTLRLAAGAGCSPEHCQLRKECAGRFWWFLSALHRFKYAERGFNQARSLAVHALDALGKSHPAWRLTLASEHADAAARHESRCLTWRSDG